MDMDDIKEKIDNLRKAREMDFPGISGIERFFFLEFIQQVADEGHNQLKEMAGYIISKYDFLMSVDYPEHNLCKDAMNQIQQDMLNGTLKFEQKGDLRVFTGTNVIVFKEKNEVTIKTIKEK